ncbi:hypothetical protein [Allocoleopsis franciscana]|uniref:Uncharacterized protein n=1 Tax=Allocoleopsis franciscana PCC 7113 TaxID=1173027 RepID=K9WE20_9CYAN|nr:hypothetical protein [Allocoleopsis franciscana]AFZ18620.1 hypothetical protein Mic7113_2838 [Allocoleopsis franciscana PCC 7113]
MNKSQAIKLLKDEGWTEADAKRALAGIDFSTNPGELAIRRTISSFAGTELIQRQRLQAAQKGMVTKKTKEIERKDEEYGIQINQYEESLKLAKEKYESEIQALLLRKTDLETQVNSIALQNNELLRVNEQLEKDKLESVKVKEELEKDNKNFKNIVDAIKLEIQALLFK